MKPGKTLFGVSAKDSLVAQTVKRLPAMWETWVRSLGGEDPLETEMATHSSILACRNPTDGGGGWAPVRGVTESQTRLIDNHKIPATRLLPFQISFFPSSWSLV